jgi:ATP/maltotriose-dependent transcriptional regulator MalT
MTIVPARTHLLYGARQRRSGQPVKAREQLRTAHDAFAEMGLTAWVHRAADELAATGPSRTRRPHSTEPLTSQETRVALHASKGMSNKENRRALFLSPKTVEHHQQRLPEAGFPLPRGARPVVPSARGRLTRAAIRAPGR